jgi:hypothetical protein
MVEKKKRKFDHLLVGDQVWVTRTSYRRGNQTEVSLDYRIVKKVGRLYLTIGEPDRVWDDAQFSIEDGYEKGEANYRRRMYLDDAQYYAERRLERVWWSFRDQVQKTWAAPKDVTTEQVLEAARILGLQIDDPSPN